jgi:hypothetical protein
MRAISSHEDEIRSRAFLYHAMEVEAVIKFLTEEQLGEPLIRPS